MRKVPHLEVVMDYLRGLKCKKIIEKHNISRGSLQYSLEKMGVRPNRIKSSARLKLKVRKSKGGYLQNAGFIPVVSEKVKDNNPVLKDDLDIMERYNDDGASDPSCEININKEGEFEYENED